MIVKFATAKTLYDTLASIRAKKARMGVLLLQMAEHPDATDEDILRASEPYRLVSKLLREVEAGVRERMLAEQSLTTRGAA